MYDMALDYIEIVAGTSKTYSTAYQEAANNIDVSSTKGLKILTNFLNNIESLNNKASVKDTRISSSKGNIKSFSSYENVKSAINFLSKNFGDAPDVKECITVFDALEKYTPQYKDAYTKNNRIVILEYENALYLLVTALSSIIANRLDVVTDGEEIRIKKSGVNRAGVIEKAINGLAKQLGDRDHGCYLDALLDATNTEVKEAVSDITAGVAATIGMVGNLFRKGGELAKKGINIFKSAKNTFFGIVPLIRSVLYLRYKKKADTILSLEQQIVFIQNNIEILQNKKSMDPEKKKAIIKKQKAVIEQYKKKAAKLRAELTETEKEASSEQAVDDKKINNTDDDFILENGKSIKDFFESADVRTKRMQNALKKYDIHTSALNTSIAENDIKVAEKILDVLFKNTKQKSIGLTLGKGAKTDEANTKSKIGGIPYWPIDEKWPMGKQIVSYKDQSKNKEIPMICLAQINFAEMPKLDGYPTSGLMQFFIVDIDGSDISGCKVFYRKDTKKAPLKEVPRSTINDEYTPDLGIDEVYYVTGKIEEKPCNPAEEDYDIELTKAINTVMGTSISRYNEIPNNINNAIWKVFGDRNYWSDGARIGGHPYFTQYDPRSKDVSTLLMQIDSENGIMWGDCGIANFFCSEAALKKLDFSDVFFTWDCC